MICRPNEMRTAGGPAARSEAGLTQKLPRTFNMDHSKALFTMSTGHYGGPGKTCVSIGSHGRRFTDHGAVWIGVTGPRKCYIFCFNKLRGDSGRPMIKKPNTSRPRGKVQKVASGEKLHLSRSGMALLRRDRVHSVFRPMAGVRRATSHQVA